LLLLLLTTGKMEVDEALAMLGTIGRWQVRYFSMVGAACMVLPCLHMLAINYIGECTRTVVVACRPIYTE